MTITDRPRLRLALAALCGLAAAMGQVPVSLPFVALLGLAGLAALVSGATGPRAAFGAGFAAGIAYFGATLHWIVQPFLVDLARHAWMAPFALVFFAAGFALFWAAGAAFARILGGGPVAFAGAFAAMESARALILTGFPWVLLGYVWSETDAAQIQAWTGPFGLTFLTLLGAGVVARLSRRRAGAALALFASLALLPGLVGGLRIAPPTTPLSDAPVIRIVQPNIPQREKWRGETAWAFLDALKDATATAPRADLTIWPETTVPFAVHPGQPELAGIAAAASDRPVLFGATRVEDGIYYNALVRLGPGGRIVDAYDKHHLVPFGEYIPLLARLQGFASGYTAGSGPRLMDLGPFGTLLPLICYEAIFPVEIGAAPRPDWLLQITNDAWFGTLAGPQQHLAQARLRAIEQGLPLVRAANTGISAVIDARGRIVQSLPLGTAGVIDAPLPPDRIRTLYSRTGDWPALVAIAASFWLTRRRPTPHPAR